VRLLWFRRWTIVAFSIVFFALAVIEIRRSDPVYTSTTRIHYEPIAAQVMDLGPITGTSWRARQDALETAVRIIDSPVLGDAVLDSLSTSAQTSVQMEYGFVSPVNTVRRFVVDAQKSLTDMVVSYRPAPVDPELVERQGRVNGLLGMVTCSMVGETNLIDISATSRDRLKAVRVANAFAAEFIDHVERENRLLIGSAEEYLDKAIEEQKAALEEAERDLFEGSKKSDTRLMDESRETAIRQLQSLNDDLLNATKELGRLESGRAGIAAEDMAARALAEDGFYRALVEQRSKVEIELVQMRAENNPDSFQPYVKKDREAKALDEQISISLARFVESAAAKLEADIRVAQMHIEKLRVLVAEQQAVFDQIEVERIEVRMLQRDVEAATQIYNKLLEEYKEIDVARDIQTSRVSIISPASVPSGPSSPLIGRTLTTYTIFGFALGCLTVLGLSFLDRSVKDPMQVETRLRIPTLGFVPPLAQLAGKTVKGRRIPVQILEPNSKRQEAEAFRYLRASVQYSSARHSPQVMLVTSCYPKEGKSTIASNLAVSAAEQGRRTLLIDGDLKRPSIHRIVPGMARFPGLTDVLTGQTPLAQAVCPTQISPELFVLPAGRTSPSPVTLLESGAMSDLIELLREQYDTVIIDSAPAFGMADAMVLSKKVDGIILVIKQGNTPFEVLKKTAEQLGAVGARILGGVYNAPDRAQRGKGYGYGYGYGGYGYGGYGYGGYGYGYGYGYGKPYGYAASDADSSEDLESKGDELVAKASNDKDAV